MSRTKRTRLPAAERRELIEAAAMAVFAERGYHGASIEAIARAAGVTAPIVYDHFASKLELHRRLLERQRDELLGFWREHLPADLPPERRFAHAVDAYYRYVEDHPYAVRMFFRDTSGDPGIQAMHREIQAQGRALLTLLLAQQIGEDGLPGARGPAAMEMAAELLRCALSGLAIWWYDHPEVPREEVVAIALAFAGPALEKAAGR